MYPTFSPSTKTPYVLGTLIFTGYDEDHATKIIRVILLFFLTNETTCAIVFIVEGHNAPRKQKVNYGKEDSGNQRQS